jgi:hypothetical protein
MMKVFLIDIDGLRSEIFTAALTDGGLPHLARLVGGVNFERGVQVPALAPAPSITFCSQASLFTGAHPSQHGIPGNQYFDRFGTRNGGKPRHYAFDVGDTLAVDDAVQVFMNGLASECLRVPTMYERFTDYGWRSVVAGNMYAKGAATWIKPSLVNITRFTKGGNIFGMESAEYDRHILDQVIDQTTTDGLPEVLTVYFMGLDHESHLHGPEVQMDYLTDVIDPMVGDLWDFILNQERGLEHPLVAIFSDHGQIRVIPDDRHSLRLAFPFEREIGHLFDALGLDVHDFPGEDPDCDAVVAANGGLGYVYLQNQRGRWADAPEFDRDLLPIGRAFWEAHQTGKYATELAGALSGVLVRNVARNGWDAPYQAITPDGDIVPLEKWFGELARQQKNHGAGLYVDPVHRLGNLVSPFVGDLLLISNYAEGYYFGSPLTGVHGGLHPDDSRATLVFGYPGKSEIEANQMRIGILDAIETRCQTEGGRQPSTADLITGLFAILE